MALPVENIDRLLAIARDRWLRAIWVQDMTVAEVAQRDMDGLLEARWTLTTEHPQ